MLLILLTLLISLLVFEFSKHWKHFKLALQIPGPWFIPFIGCVQIAVKMKPEDITNVVQGFREKYQKTFRLFLGPNLWVFLHSPEEIKQALNNSSLHRAADFQQLKPILGEGLLLSEEQKWSSTRRALNPGFNGRLLDNFAERIGHHADILVQILEQHNAQSIEVSEFIFNCILDVICETSMGAEISSQSDPNCQYAKAYHEAFHLLFQRMVNPLLGFDLIFNRMEAAERLSKAIALIHEMTDRVIGERRLLHSNTKADKDDDDAFSWLEDEFGNKRKMAMLDILLNVTVDGKYLSDKEIKDEVNTFLFAGVDTTKAAMCFALYNLAKYPSIQKEIYDEITATYSPTDVLSFDTLKSMTNLDQFLKESMRLHTIVPLTGRRTTLDDTKIGNIVYPKNTSIWISMYGLAHDATYFPDPYEFKMDRFCDSNDIHSMVYLPFSAGPHNCIGKRYAMLIMKIILVRIVSAFEVRLKNPDEKLTLISEMVLSARQGFNMIFNKRNISV